jgi:hypothetical protein
MVGVKEDSIIDGRNRILREVIWKRRINIV